MKEYFRRKTLDEILETLGWTDDDLEAFLNGSKEMVKEPITPEDLDDDTLLIQTAEEASELAQACLKFTRIGSDNPTPKSEEECWKSFKEEMADVLLCLTIISDKLDIEEELDKIAIKKYDRWVKRLNEGTD